LLREYTKNTSYKGEEIELISGNCELFSVVMAPIETTIQKCSAIESTFVTASEITLYFTDLPELFIYKSDHPYFIRCNGIMHVASCSIYMTSWPAVTGKREQTLLLNMATNICKRITEMHQIKIDVDYRTIIVNESTGIGKHINDILQMKDISTDF
jgi:hypothetical protein